MCHHHTLAHTHAPTLLATPRLISCTGTLLVCCLKLFPLPLGPCHSLWTQNSTTANTTTTTTHPNPPSISLSFHPPTTVGPSFWGYFVTVTSPAVHRHVSPLFFSFFYNPPDTPHPLSSHTLTPPPHCIVPPSTITPSSPVQQPSPPPPIFSFSFHHTTPLFLAYPFHFISYPHPLSPHSLPLTSDLPHPHHHQQQHMCPHPPQCDRPHTPRLHFRQGGGSPSVVDDHTSSKKTQAKTQFLATFFFIALLMTPNPPSVPHYVWVYTPRPCRSPIQIHSRYPQFTKHNLTEEVMMVVEV